MDDDKNIIAKKLGGLPTQEMNLTNIAEAFKPYEITYLESLMRTMDYGQGHPPRTLVDPYTNNNPLLKTIGRRKPSEVTFFGRETVLLNIT